MSIHLKYRKAGTSITIELGYLQPTVIKGPLGMNKTTYTLRATLRVGLSSEGQQFQVDIDEKQVKEFGETDTRARAGAQLAAAAMMAAVRENHA
jgi:hypothetical protein